MVDILNFIKCIKEDQSFRIDVPGTYTYLRLAHANLSDATYMAKWRTLHYQQFLTWIKPTPEQLLQWLNSNKLKNDDMMLILESEEGIKLGQMSLYHINAEKKRAEFGRIIRGVADFEKEIMTIIDYLEKNKNIDDTSLLRIFCNKYKPKDNRKIVGKHVSDVKKEYQSLNRLYDRIQRLLDSC